MKKLLLLLSITMPFFAQSQSVTADPALNPMKVVSLLNANVVNTQLPIDNIIRLKVPILNKDTLNNALPVGSCKIKIGLGTKIILDPLFSLANTNTNDYISWTVVSIGGQTLITGELIQPLPAFYNDTALFNIKTITVGASTITTNFLVTNHNSPIYLSDFNGSNNIADIPYIIIAGAVPVNITNVYAENKNCELLVTMLTENEINVSHYDVEASVDLVNFEKVTTQQANNLSRYTFAYNLSSKFQVKQLYYRIKSVDVDGTFKYTGIKKVVGTCKSTASLSLYPNPATKGSSQIYIQNNNGLFNGSYNIIVSDMVGKQIQSKTLNLNNINRFYLSAETLSVGQYIIKVIDNNSKNIDYLKMIIQ